MDLGIQRLLTQWPGPEGIERAVRLAVSGGREQARPGHRGPVPGGSAAGGAGRDGHRLIASDASTKIVGAPGSLRTVIATDGDGPIHDRWAATVSRHAVSKSVKSLLFWMSLIGVLMGSAGLTR